MPPLTIDPFEILRGNILRVLGEGEDELRLTCELTRSRQQFLYSGIIRATMKSEGRDPQSDAQRQGHLLPEPPPMPQGNDWPKDVVWLTRTEEAIWSIVIYDRWLTSQEIADKCNLPNDKEMQYTLKHMAERGFLDSSPGRGYRRRRGPE